MDSDRYNFSYFWSTSFPHTPYQVSSQLSFPFRRDFHDGSHDGQLGFPIEKIFQLFSAHLSHSDNVSFCEHILSVVRACLHPTTLWRMFTCVFLNNEHFSIFQKDLFRRHKLTDFRASVRKQFLQTTSPPKPLIGLWPNLTGMILGWSSFKVVETVLIHFISRSQELK